MSRRKCYKLILSGWSRCQSSKSANCPAVHAVVRVNSSREALFVNNSLSSHCLFLFACLDGLSDCTLSEITSPKLHYRNISKQQKEEEENR